LNLDDLNKCLERLEREVEETNHLFSDNLVDGLPIPFFGDIQNAQVLSVGVNPSGGEYPLLQ
jgi:hypothetical protein